MTKHLNTNKQFMIGNGILAFAVIFIVVIFVYMSLRLNSKQEKLFDENYQIVLKEGFKGRPFEVQLNDSLLFKGDIKEEHTEFNITRFAEQSALLIIDLSTHDLKVFNLNPSGGKYAFDIHNEVVEQVYTKE